YPVDYGLFHTLSMVLILAPMILGIPLVFRKELGMGLASTAASVFGVVYVAASLTILISLRASPTQKILVILVLFSVWAGDIAAYYVGRSFGKHKLAPVVSPNKSWEGAIASVIGSIALTALVFHFQRQISGLFREGYWLLPFPSWGRQPS